MANSKNKKIFCASVFLDVHVLNFKLRKKRPGAAAEQVLYSSYVRHACFDLYDLAAISCSCPCNCSYFIKCAWSSQADSTMLR